MRPSVSTQPAQVRPSASTQPAGFGRVWRGEFGDERGGVGDRMGGFVVGVGEGGVVWLGLAMRQYSGEPGLGQSLKKRVKPPPPFVRPEDIIFCVLPKID